MSIFPPITKSSQMAEITKTKLTLIYDMKQFVHDEIPFNSKMYTYIFEWAMSITHRQHSWIVNDFKWSNGTHSVRVKREKEWLHARGVHHNLIQIQLIKLSPDNIKTIPLNMCIVHFVDCKKTHRACLCVCAFKIYI